MKEIFSGQRQRNRAFSRLREEHLGNRVVRGISPFSNRLRFVAIALLHFLLDNATTFMYCLFHEGNPMKALTHEEIHKILKVAAESKRNLAIILLGLKHGMRASEISNLELKDVDLKNGEITIRRLKGSLKTTQPLADVPGQPLLSEKRVLRAWLDERGKHPSPRVFISQKSGRLHRSQLHRIFADIAEQAGLPKDKRHIHVLKHSLGVSMVEANVNLAVIKQALGHKSIASTAVYTVPTDETAGKAIISTFANMF